MTYKMYKGVSCNRGTKRYEACIWMPDAVPASAGRRSRGRQLYCGSFVTPELAARARDQVIISLFGACPKKLNFPLDDYDVPSLVREGVASARARVMRTGRYERFPTTQLRFVGVTKSSNGQGYEARCNVGSTYSYLGKFDTAEAAGRAYDECAMRHRGEAAMTNFDYTSEERRDFATRGLAIPEPSPWLAAPEPLPWGLAAPTFPPLSAGQGFGSCEPPDGLFFDALDAERLCPPWGAKLPTGGQSPPHPMGYGGLRPPHAAPACDTAQVDKYATDSSDSE